MRNKFFLKIALIGGLIVLLMLPLGMIRGVVTERSSYRFQVEQDIANTWTGEQLLAGPLLSVPYSVRYKEKQWNKESERYDVIEKTRWSQATFMPESLTIGATIDTEYRSRGIYNVPVYAGRFKVDGTFSRAAIDEYRKQTKGFSKWGLPRLSLAIDDVRGIGSNPTLAWSNESVNFDPGTAVDDLGDGIQARLPALPTDGEMLFSIELELRGSRHLRIAPIARDVNVRLQSPWPHPKFTGRFLPSAHNVTADGFEAEWQMSSFSTSAAQVLAECVSGNCGSLKATSFGVRFIETVDLYQKVTRAVKYGLLFVLLTFVAFFLTETLSSKPLHPVHYTLVGASLAIFYLLLISLSEHIGFASAYLAATVGCAGLIGVYLASVLGSSRQGMLYGAGISVLYAMLFAILRSEDFALLMGSLLLFGMLAAVMLTTRRVDWYEVGEKVDRAGGGSRDAAGPG